MLEQRAERSSVTIRTPLKMLANGMRKWNCYATIYQSNCTEERLQGRLHQLQSSHSR